MQKLMQKNVMPFASQKHVVAVSMKKSGWVKARLKRCASTLCIVLGSLIFSAQSSATGNVSQSKNISQSTNVLAEQKCHSVSVQVLGSGGPELDDGRTSSGYLIWVDEKARLLVDAGTGSSVQFGATGAKLEDLEGIILSHLHTDHAADIPSFIKGSYFTSRKTSLPVIGPKGNDVMPSTQAFVNALIQSTGAFPYLSSYLDAQNDDYTVRPMTVTQATLERPFQQVLGSDITVEALTVHHGPIPALSWRVKVNGCEIVFSGDTNDKARELAKFGAHADLLVLHNAIDDNASASAKNLHMTPDQLIAVAQASQAKRVLISHIMKRSEPGLEGLVEAIAVVAPGSVFAAKELMNISLSE